MNDSELGSKWNEIKGKDRESIICEKVEEADLDTKKKFIKMLRNDQFVYLAGKPPTKKEIDEMEKELLDDI